MYSRILEAIFFMGSYARFNDVARLSHYIRISYPHVGLTRNCARMIAYVLLKVGEEK